MNELLSFSANYVGQIDKQRFLRWKCSRLFKRCATGLNVRQIMSDNSSSASHECSEGEQVVLLASNSEALKSDFTEDRCPNSLLIHLGKLMPTDLGIENLSASEIEILLECGQDLLPPTQLLEVQLFIQRIGGLQNAYHAVKVLREVERN